MDGTPPPAPSSTDPASSPGRIQSGCGAAGGAPLGAVGAAEVLDLLPTIAKVTAAVGGPAYDGTITAEVLRLATGGPSWEPATVLPVLNLFAELPGIVTDE